MRENSGIPLFTVGVGVAGVAVVCVAMGLNATADSTGAGVA